MRERGSRLRRVLAAPAVHFVLVGTALLAADGWLRAGAAVTPEAVARTITVTRADRARLAADWAQQWGRPPTPDERRALVRQWIDEEVLLREALARGLGRDDRVVRTRLARLAAFLGESGAETDLVAEARRLGLDRSDLVVRRYLVQSMRLLASQPARADELTDADVAAWFEAHRERFRQPARSDLVHVYLGRDRRGDALARDADALLARLRRDAVAPEQATRFGDPFIRGPEMRASSAVDLERAFGPGFAERVAAVPVGEWSGPIASAYGLHLVFVRGRTPPAVPALGAVRNQVVHGLLEERKEARLAAQLAEWRRRYVVVVEGGDA